MNEYLENALHHLRRASALLADNMTEDDVHDAVIQFGFGIEKLCKSILFGVNPVYLLESPGFDNSINVFYSDKMIPSVRAKSEKESGKKDGMNRNVIPLQASMLRAAKFSQGIEDNIGVFTKLADMRGTVAHRVLSQLNTADAQRFLLRLFHPIVTRLAAELGFSADQCFHNNAKAELLATMSQKLTKEENLKEKMEALLSKHYEEWLARKGDLAFVDKAKRETSAALANGRRSDPQARDQCCPACQNEAIMFVEADWDVEGASGEGYITGVYVAGLECKFCGLEVYDFEETDYLKLNEYLRGD
jgi:hypothetical protein